MGSESYGSSSPNLVVSECFLFADRSRPFLDHNTVDTGCEFLALDAGPIGGSNVHSDDLPLRPNQHILAQFDVGCKQNSSAFVEFCCLDFTNNSDVLRSIRQQAAVIRKLQEAVQVVGFPSFTGGWFGWLKSWGSFLVGGLCVLVIICMLIPVFCGLLETC